MLHKNNIKFVLEIYIKIPLTRAMNHVFMLLELNEMLDFW